MLFIYAIYLCYELDNIYNDTMVLLPLKLKPTASLQTLQTLRKIDERKKTPVPGCKPRPYTYHESLVQLVWTG